MYHETNILLCWCGRGKMKIHIVVFPNGWGNSQCCTDCINAWRKRMKILNLMFEKSLSWSLSLNLRFIWSLNEFQPNYLLTLWSRLEINSKIMWFLWQINSWSFNELFPYFSFLKYCRNTQTAATLLTICYIDFQSPIIINSIFTLHMNGWESLQHGVVLCFKNTNIHQHIMLFE